jgi:hypothetical protein
MQLLPQDPVTVGEPGLASATAPWAAERLTDDLDVSLMTAPAQRWQPVGGGEHQASPKVNQQDVPWCG